MGGASPELMFELFLRALSLWWVILPASLIGIVVGILPGFSAQNTLIILLPLTLTMNIEVALAFMISLYCATQLGGGKCCKKFLQHIQLWHLRQGKY